MGLFRKLTTTRDNSPPSSCEKNRRANEFGFYASKRRRAELTKEHWTCENELYRFPIDESPKDPWERCFGVVDQADDELYKELKDEISGLLVVASLFLGIVTAFSTMTLGWIRKDHTKLSAALLGDIVTLLNNTDARGTIPHRDMTNLEFVPRDSDIAINQMWFLSMTLSLSAVVAGTLCLQWLSSFRRKEPKQRPFIESLALRQLRFEGLMGWGVPHVPAFLLLTVQSSLILFAIGLVYLLWSVDNRVAIPVVIVGGVAALFLTATAILPLLQSVIGWIFPSTLIVPQCPYKSPLSWIFHRSCLLLSLIVTLPFCLLPCPKKPVDDHDHAPLRRQWLSQWRLNQLDILKDYRWQTFDDLWRRQRERWGPQQSKSQSQYSYYLVNGLASAMEKLVFQPDAVHIIHTCLQDFHGTSAEEETFQHLLGKDNPVVEQAFSEYNAIFPKRVDEKSKTRLSDPHKENLRRDFLNAHALQHFVAKNSKLHHALLPHRVELYARIKNSSQYIDPPPKEELKCSPKSKKQSAGEQRIGASIGDSIKCPIRSPRDAEALEPELRYQFLKFAEWFISTEEYKESDDESLEYVLDAMKKTQTVTDDDIDKISIEDRMKSFFKMVENHLTPKSNHRKESTSATASVCDSQSRGEDSALFGTEHVSQGQKSQRDCDDQTDAQSSPDAPFATLLTNLHDSVREKFNSHKFRNRPKLAAHLRHTHSSA